MKILVISSCSSTKKHNPVNRLQVEDFSPPKRFAARTAELKPYEVPAAEMYTGEAHKLVMEGLELVRGSYEQSTIDLSIISAGYGLLSATDLIVPYDVTFEGLGVARSDVLELNRKVGNLIKDYELVFFLLGKEYVQALRLPFGESGPGEQVPETVTQIFLLGASYRKLIPDAPNVHFVPAGNALSQTLGVMGVELKGFIFKKICEAVCRDGLQLFEDIRQNPQMIRDIALEGK